MLVIRNEQMLALEEAQTNRFAEELVLHIQEFAPMQSELLGREVVRRIVDLGLSNARRYEFRCRAPVRLYVELMFMFGSAFDTDPQYTWADPALRGMRETEELERADRLYEMAMDYVNQAAGPEQEYERAALDKALELTYEQLVPFTSRPLSDLASFLHQLYPQKCEYIGQSALTSLIDEGYAAAAERGPDWQTGGPMFVGLMFIFGHGCFTDPQFPWIAGTLNDAPPDTAAHALERLSRKFALYLNRAKTNLEAS